MPARPQPTQIERDKLTIDPDFDFRDIAQRPFRDITTNEIGMFKWSGVYHQIQPGFFMLRLRVPGGLLNAEQLQRAGQLAARYGQERLCITTRQCLQFHWLRKEDIYKVIEGLEEVGVLTKNACGDVTRNVVTCPLAGVCPHELTDTRSMLLRIANDPEILDQQRNLPRKHKISVAGCHRACGQTVMNCQGWHPVRRGGADDSIVGWKFHAGGGLGAQPRMADVIFEWVPADLVVEVARATTEAYRRLGNRRNRFQARLKLVVEVLGSRGFAEYVRDILRERNIEGLERIELADSPHADIGDDYLEGKSIIEQKNGRYAVRVRIPRGELRHDDPSRFAHWAQRYGDGLIMLTNRQNLVLRNVRDKDKEPLIAELRTAGFELNGFEHLPDAVACVGTSACPLAVSETPNIYRRILSELTCDQAWWQEIGPLRLNMNGCPNSCAQRASAEHRVAMRPIVSMWVARCLVQVTWRNTYATSQIPRSCPYCASCSSFTSGRETIATSALGPLRVGWDQRCCATPWGVDRSRQRHPLCAVSAYIRSMTRYCRRCSGTVRPRLRERYPMPSSVLVPDIHQGPIQPQLLDTTTDYGHPSTRLTG
jgi:ferredoxin-nitrite reductase